MTISKIINKPWKLVVLIVSEVAIFSIALWLSARIVPANEAISNAIIILCIFAVGITIILYGNVTRKRGLNMLGFALFLFAVFVVIDRYEGFAVKISAFAVLLMAFAAFANIEESRRLRKEERQRLALERIRGWAEGLCELIMRPTSRATKLEERLAELDVWLQTTAGRSLGVLADAEQLGGDLNSYIKGAHLAIFEFVARLRGDDAIATYKSEYKIEYELKPIGSLEELLEAKRELMRTLNDVIDSATKTLVPLR